MYGKIFPNELVCGFFDELFFSLGFPKAFVKKPTVTWPKGLVFPASWFCLGLDNKAAGDHLMLVREIQVTL